MTVPRISVVIPVYNRPGMIAECLASLAPSLDMLHEVIVVDDGSTDGVTPAAVRAAIAALGDDRVRLVEQTNAGPGAARNTGAAEASGDWLAFLDSDDLWLPWTGRALRSTLERHPDVLVVFLSSAPFATRADLEGFADCPAEEIPSEDFFALHRMRPIPAIFGAGYFAIGRTAFLAQDGFVSGLRGAEDTDLFYRIAGKGRFLVLKHPVPVARRTSNDDSLTHNVDAVVEGVVFMLNQHRAGAYDTPNRKAAERALADLLAFWLHDMFWRGYGKEAYQILLGHGSLGIMFRNGHRLDALKLLFIPVLAAIRPKNHRFRWRPASS